MESRTMPGTDLAVSPLCLGTMTFGTPVAEPDAVRVVHRALELGVNFFDTANMYEGYARYVGSPGGVAEELLGRALRGRRQQAVVATKVGMKIGPDAADEGLAPAHIRRECDRSLRRLAIDRVDLYYMHRPDTRTPVAESIAAFAALIRAGKVRYWGVSNFSAAQVRQVLQICDAHRWPRPVAHQPPYSLLQRGIEAELLPLCRQERIAVVPYQVLQGGLLTGKYVDATAPPADSRAAEKPAWLPLLQDSATMAAVDRLRDQAAAAGLELLDYVLRTTASVSGITSMVVGVKRLEQLERLVRAMG